MSDRILTRRQALLVAGGGILAACTSEQREAYAQNGPGKCLLTPQATEGPFYLDPKLERADIREGRRGTPLTLRIAVAEAGNCGPVSRARVDIWHCDAAGVYSSFEDQPGGVNARGEHFLRGHQFTDASGAATFRTIWPGWYPGRVPHIHFKVYLGGAEALTAQLYFPDDLNAKVYGTNAAYPRKWTAAARNDTDGIYRGARGTGLARVTQAAEGWVASLDVGVDRA